MERTKVGWTELEFSRIGLGAWAMGGGGWNWSWGPQEDRKSIATIHHALELGINWIDTAPIYGLGRSEEVVGQAIRGMAERPYLATKCEQVWDKDGSAYGSMKRESILTEAEASLRRLGVEVIDLYQIHWPDPEEEIEEGWRAIEELIQAGKIRYGGVSNFSVDQMQRAQAIHPIATLQPPYSMLRRGIEAEILPYCAGQDIGVIVYSPMQKGLLTGKVDQEWVRQLPEDDHRRRDANFQEPKLSATMALVDELEQIARAAGNTVAQLAIAWTLRRPEVTAAIVGAREPSQIEETALAADWRLSAAELESIDQLLARREAVLASA